MGKVKVVVRIKPGSNRAVQRVSNTALTVEDPSIYSSPLVSEFSCHAVVENEPLEAALRASTFQGETLVIGYGHSGSGKTFTIFGPGGVLESIPFDSEFLDVSFLEVYNERVYDLLGGQGPLPVLEDIFHHTVVKDLATIRVESVGELDAVVSVGLNRRAEAENAVHLHSSRSHAILQLKKPSGESVWLCDLAGSERTRKMGNHGAKNESREINSIHKSLHALRRCIMALRRNEHVPARSSVLTRLLFSAHNIDQCILIACVSPERESVSETLSTLDFAASGLAVQQWMVPGPPVRASGNEAEQLRTALEQVRRELQKEKARRIALEHEITRNSTPSFWATAARTSNPTPENVEDPDLPEQVSESPPLFQDHSLKWSPISTAKENSRADAAPSSIEESVFSQTWRHNQYDAILKRCWASS